MDVSFEEILQDVEQRDYNDMHRDISPLRQAEDARLVDTTLLDLEQSLDVLVSMIREEFPVKNDQKVKYKPLSKQGTDRLYHIVFWPVAFFFSIFHPVRTIGREHIPEGAAVIAANHSAYADPMMAIMAFGYRNPLRIMAK